MSNNIFEAEAEKILGLKVIARVNSLGGYGEKGEVIYEKHPIGCPSTLVTSFKGAKSTFMTNGSVAFEVKMKEGMEITVLAGSFDSNEKHETNAPSSNIWIEGAEGKDRYIASLMNPSCNLNCEPVSMKVVKLGDPYRAMWFTYSFTPSKGLSFQTAVKLSLVDSPKGPALLRQVYIKNTGKKRLKSVLWAYFNLQGTQKFVYNKSLWYDSGLPVSEKETVVACPVPYTDIVQIKRISSSTEKRLKSAGATCDYTAFIGNMADFALLPSAVKKGKLLGGAGTRLNRFSVPTVYAGMFLVDLLPGKDTSLSQSLQYMTDTETIKEFRKASACSYPAYEKVEKAFIDAANGLIKKTPGAEELTAEKKSIAGSGHPDFEIEFKNSKVVSEYAKSVWTGVQELYENCRAHGSMLADGIELGTRDRGQDMWPKLKEDPGRVREDLLHALSFMYLTVEDGHKWKSPMSRVEKLHGMFPRQFPSRWLDRSKAVMNDNRPYNDSAVWLINSLQKYINETGDIGILLEKVKSVNLTKPETPEQSGLVGCEKEFTIAEIMFGILECYNRHAEDSPYGLVQIMYGEWCDPIDMFGTSVIGDALTRGIGRGVNIRLSAQVFNSMVDVVDLFETSGVKKLLKNGSFNERIAFLKCSADKLRKNLVKWAWEPGSSGGAFINCIHELKRDGSRPDYAKGEKGYTLGSYKGFDFDGINRRELLAQAHSLPAVLKERDYLEPVKDKELIVKELLKTVDGKLYHKKLGLLLFAPPISNDENSRKLVGRMGIVPAGTAENGEYHHAQLMMHSFRIKVAGEEDRAWEQFKAVVSATRDESLGGPFEMPSTSYASDPDDPHYGKGMYFGLSGSTDWIVEFLQEIAGVQLALHDDAKPDIRISPRMPSELKGQLTFKRFIHSVKKNGGYEKIPFTLEISGASGKTGKIKKVTVNGKQAEKPDVKSVSGMKEVKVAIEYV